jgi:hypothetical protein
MSELTDPWVVQAPKQAAQVPTGTYVGAEFVAVEDFTLPKTGEAKWKWRWKIKTGAEANKEATALTDKSISSTTLPGRLLSGLLGKPLVPGENVKSLVDGCKGKLYVVVVAEGTKGGKPGVRVVSPMPSM